MTLHHKHPLNQVTRVQYKVDQQEHMFPFLLIFRSSKSKFLCTNGIRIEFKLNFIKYAKLK